MTAIAISPAKCALGEGPLWHPLTGDLYWFDIIENTLHRRGAQASATWVFEQNVSAAGWINETDLLIASETELFRFSTTNETMEPIVPLEAQNPLTRSNDGRADRAGGFWIGTMGKNAQAQAGAIYRFWKGELRTIRDNVSIPNAICFSPSGDTAYYTDTVLSIVFSQALHPITGWPEDDPEPFLDFTHQARSPDGAVTDAKGNIWIAFWGEGRVQGFSRKGKPLDSVNIPTPNATCPAFSGKDLKTMCITSAMQGLGEESKAQDNPAGQTFAAQVRVKGLLEPAVIL